MFFKVLTHDFRPPIQGGAPVWDGQALPHGLPRVHLDTSNVECGAGWNYTASLADALRIAGLWPNGRPSACFTVEPSDDAIERGNKCRCSQLTLTGRVSSDDIRAAVLEMSGGWFVDEHRDRMIDSQFAWYRALARPFQPPNEQRIEDALKEALEARGLEWELRRYDSAWGARDALFVEHAALNGWIDRDPLKLTTGLREAYEFGLELAIPVAPNTLGWSSQP